MSSGTPEADYPIDERLVRDLLSDQHPDLADLPLRPLGEGWDNAMFRLGDELTVRLPRREIAAPLIVNEQDWLPSLVGALPVAIPVPVRVGIPGRGYPWRWSVLPWLEGTPADQALPDANQAAPLAAFLLALHKPAPADAPVNPVRGVSLQSRAAGVEERLQRLRTKTDLVTQEIDTVWQAALAAPVATDVSWLHGDMHAQNVLVRDGVISGVIDWGDITSGDVATDLACVWMLLSEASARDDALSRYVPCDDTLARAKGWAVLFGAVLLDTGLVDNPRHAAVGAATLRRISEDG